MTFATSNAGLFRWLTRSVNCREAQLDALATGFEYITCAVSFSYARLRGILRGQPAFTSATHTVNVLTSLDWQANQPRIAKLSRFKCRCPQEDGTLLIGCRGKAGDKYYLVDLNLRWGPSDEMGEGLPLYLKRKCERLSAFILVARLNPSQTIRTGKRSTAIEVRLLVERPQGRWSVLPLNYPDDPAVLICEGEEAYALGTATPETANSGVLLEVVAGSLMAAKMASSRRNTAPGSCFCKYSRTWIFRVGAGWMF